MENIEFAVKKIKIILTILNIVQIIGLFFVNLAINFITSNFEFEDSVSLVIRLVGNGFVLLMVVLQNIILLSRAKITKEIMEQPPIEVSIVDFITTTYKVDNKTKYNVDLIVKDMETGELYFAYGDSNLSFYDVVYGRNGGIFSEVGVIKKDGSVVEIGSKAKMYVKKYTNVKVSIDHETNELRLNNKVFSYQNVNKSFDNDIFQKLTYFEGIIDVDL